MRHFFIKGTAKRYSIREDGKVIKHYRYLKNGKKLNTYHVVPFSLNRRGRNTPVVSLFIDGRQRGTLVISLMVEYFNIQKPDGHHQYFIQHKDGDHSNCSLENLEYRINTKTKYYPQPFYNKKNEIIKKRCGKCGDIKEIKHFHFQQPRKKGGRRTYRNECESCRAARQWAHIKSTPKSLKSHKEACKKWISDPENRKKYLANRKEDRKELKDWYLNQLIRKEGMNPEVFDDGMREVLRSKIKLNRFAREN